MPQTDYEIVTKITLDTAQAIKNLKQLNQELAKKKKDFKAVGTSAKESSAVVTQSTKKEGKAVKDSTKAVKNKNKAWEDLGKTVKRVALVAFAAAAVALRRIVRWMNEAATASSEFQRTMYLFEVSIRALQRVGFDTSIADWREEIERFKEQFPIFSEQEVVSAITNATLKMREYEFTMEEINNILELSAVLARATGKDFGELATQITGALTRGYFEALQNLGIPIGRITVMQEAYNKGLEKSFTMLSEAERAHLGYEIVMRHTAVITEDLGTVTTQVFDRMRIAEADITDATKDLGNVWVEVVVRIKEAWADFLELFLKPITIQNPFKGVADNLETFLSAMSRTPGDTFDVMAKQMASVNDELEIWRGADVEAFWQKAESALEQYTKGLEKTLLVIRSLEEEDVRSVEQQERLDEAYRTLVRYTDELEELTGLEFTVEFDEGMTEQEINDTITDITKQLVDAEGELALNPHLKLLVDTGQVETALDEMNELIGHSLGDITDATEDAADDMVKEMERAAKEMGEALSGISVWFEVRTREAVVKLQNDLSRMTRDLANDLAKIQRNLAFAIAKANADARNKIADKNKKHREEEEKAEEELLRKLKRLREDFLMDLEDALRERDALRVIQLTREYNVDVRRAIEDFEAKKKRRKEDHADEIADIKAQNARRIAELRAQAAKEAKERKIAAAIAEEERRIKHEEEMEALQRQLQDKLDLLAEEFANEYELTAKWLNEFSKLLISQYDEGSALHGFATKIAQAIGLLHQLQQTKMGLGFGGRYSGDDPYDPASNYGEGGVLLATKPTVAVFGEAGPELVHFTPLADVSSTRNLNRTITEAGIPQDTTVTHEGGMNIQEQLGLEIWLQEGLEGRIIDRTLGEAAKAFNVMLGRR